MLTLKWRPVSTRLKDILHLTPVHRTFQSTALNLGIKLITFDCSDFIVSCNDYSGLHFLIQC